MVSKSTNKLTEKKIISGKLRIADKFVFLLNGSQDTAVSPETRLDNQQITVRFPAEGKRLSSCPKCQERLWGPSLPFNG
jgi:hypothetical protein